MRRRGSRPEHSPLKASLDEPLLLGRDGEDDLPRTPEASGEDADGSQARNRRSDGSSSVTRVGRGISHSERKAWQANVVALVAQWVAWFGLVVRGAGSMISTLGGSVIGALLLRSGLGTGHHRLEVAPLRLSPDQEANLAKLKMRLTVPFDGSREEHQEALRALWRCAYPAQKLTGMVSQQWKDMGWQGTDPATDFRGGGFISLENLLHLAYRYPHAFRRLLNKSSGKRAEWEYPFAVAGLNLTFMLIKVLDLHADVPRSLPGRAFMRLLGEDEKAFDELYCVAFEMMDREWLLQEASYMEFNAVMAAVKVQVEYALVQPGVRTLSDLPAYASLVAN
eukprot:TRINITY_DN194_c0_g2_i1.p1 TRINITY_DN194_c0_g2~~TRINITY_DN194_c0_g2_i1.p1  ORF type:complete len:337 (-),score=56.84 TRINITY_DN194_c0_g2_i1:1081-2091(-)